MTGVLSSVVVIVAVLFSYLSSAEASVCHSIKHSWWKDRVHYTTYNRHRYGQEALDYCKQWNGQPTACQKAPLNTANGVFVKCTIEGHGSHTCVPSPCSYLNNGFCTPEATAGLCQWFEQIPDFNNPGKTINQRGCYRNPCHLGGQYNNHRDYCEGSEMRALTGLYRPKVQCTWCGGYEGVGCQNSVFQPKTGCDSIQSDWINNLAKENANAGRKVGSLMYMYVDAHDETSPYRQNTVCWDRTKAYDYNGAKHRIECLYGIHPMCHPDLGYMWKYPIAGQEASTNRRLRKSDQDEVHDVAWTMKYHGYDSPNPLTRIQDVAVDDAGS